MLESAIYALAPASASATCSSGWAEPLDLLLDHLSLVPEQFQIVAHLQRQIVLCVLQNLRKSGRAGLVEGAPAGRLPIILS
jgi:hypothetical protein